MSDITSLFTSKKAEHFPDEPQKQSERDKTAPGKTSRKKPPEDRSRLIIQIDDQDYQRIQDAASGVFRFWYCLQRLAFKKGNPFSVSYAVLSRESGIGGRQISTSITVLESLGMLSVKRGKTTRERNVYTLRSGVYVNHSGKQETASAPERDK